MNTHLARLAYEAYRTTLEAKSIVGQQLPAFDELPEGHQQAWWQAADSVAREVSKSRE
jgi:hypothetical protein